LAAGLPCVLGHADFEAQNLRWHGRKVWAVHDWDSLAWQPEAALAGAASGAFASAGPPALAPIESSVAFLVAYQEIRGRLFTAVEQEIAWAASVWMAAYNAREQALHGHTPVSRDTLRAQSAERLRRANPKLRGLKMPRPPLACAFAPRPAAVTGYFRRVSGMAAPMRSKASFCRGVGSVRTGTGTGVPAKRSSLRARAPRWSSRPW
jgi:hypothetical protein